MNIQQLLDTEYQKRNTKDELDLNKPDPLIVASKFKDEYIALACALFAYGNARLIVKFLNSIDFDILNESENEIKKYFSLYYYRFQKSDDVVNFFITLKRFKELDTIENIFKSGYKTNNDVMQGIYKIIENFHKLNDFSSDGYKFLIGKLPKLDKNNQIKLIGNSPYKRYNMYLRWMIRKDNLDLGLWSCIDKKDLILPLDTHTFKVSQNIGLLHRKTYDLKSAVLITQKLREFDQLDPIKYDFALYRLGQEKIL